MALSSGVLAGNPRLEQAALGPPSIRPLPSIEDPDAIRRIQQGLVALGFLPGFFFEQVGAGDLPGKFGPQTVVAVKAFQASAFPNDRSQWDGIVGRMTLGKLDAALVAAPGPGPAPGPSPGPSPTPPSVVGEFEGAAQTRSDAETAAVTMAYDIVLPASVNRAGPRGTLAPLEKMAPNAAFRQLMYLIQKKGRLYWVGACVPQNATKFDEAQIFFHPAPGQAGLKDANYEAFDGGWDNVYRYVPWLGSQLAHAGRNQVLLVPFMAGHMYSTHGVLAGNPIGSTSALLTLVKETITGDASPVSVTSIGVSSFSVGISAMATFAHLIAGSGLLRELTDFDGLYSNSPHKSFSGAGGATFRRYTQSGGMRPTVGRTYSAPLERWGAWPPGTKTYNQVHALMPNLFLHALSPGN